MTSSSTRQDDGTFSSFFTAVTHPDVSAIRLEFADGEEVTLDPIDVGVEARFFVYEIRRSVGTGRWVALDDEGGELASGTVFTAGNSAGG